MLQFPQNENHRFGYYLVNSSGKLDFFIHKKLASREVLDEASRLIEVVFHLQPLAIALRVVEKNHEEWASAINAHVIKLNELSSQNLVPIPMLLDGVISITQRLTNFLSAASAFLAQSRTEQQRRYGKGSDQYKLWDEFRQRLHASSFAYRFMYELRNFGQHRELPLSSLQVTGERVNETTPLCFKATPAIDRDKILNAGYDWKKLKSEIKTQQTQFGLTPHASEYLNCIRHIFLMAVKLESQNLAGCVGYLTKVREILSAPESASIAVFVGEPAHNAPPKSQRLMPCEQLKWLLKEYNRLLVWESEELEQAQLESNEM